MPQMAAATSTLSQSSGNTEQSQVVSSPLSFLGELAEPACTTFEAAESVATESPEYTGLGDDQL